MQIYAGIAHNKMLDEPDSKGDCGPMIEVIILTNCPEYAYGAGGLQKTYRLADARFLATPDALRELAKNLTDMAADAESMAKKVNAALEKAA